MSLFGKFNNNDLGNQDAFEEMCCQLFEVWGKRELGCEPAWTYRKIRGAGGDGGIEAYWRNNENGTWVGIQAKWFMQTLDDGEFRQIRRSINTALKLRPSLTKYIVCIPHDLTSMKGRKDKAPTKGEDEKWENFAKAVAEEYPALELDLWTASTLQTMLTLPENEGLQRFWFEKSAINPETIATEVGKATNALRGRYIPALTDDGGLSAFLDHFYGTGESRLKMLKDIDTSIAICCRLITAIRSLLEIEKDIPNQLRDSGNNAIEKLGEHISAYERLKATAAVEPVNLVEFEDYRQDDEMLYEFVSGVRELKDSHKQPNHTNEILKLVDEYEYMPSYWGLTQTMADAFGCPHCLVTGSQGTGKTCGLASKANDYLMSRRHLPILIQASRVDSNATWRDIIAGALGLGADWDETAMWQALSASAALYDTFDEHLYIRAKVAIFIDGLDERPPAKKWVEKVREADAITRQYPRIRFTFSTRPYGITTDGNPDIGKCWYQIEDDGDVPASELFDRYMDYYQIDVNGNTHYKWLLKTPMELSMFSFAHRGKKLGGDISTNLTELVNKELDRLDEEFQERHGRTAANHEQPIRDVLLSLAKAFMQGDGPLSADETMRIVSDSCGNASGATEMIRFLTSYGILDRRDEQGEPPFGTNIVTFLPGSRHLWDYFMARLLIDEDNAAAASYIKGRSDATMMYCILLVEQRGTLPVDCEELVDAFGERRTTQLSLGALANCEVEHAANYRGWALEELRQGGQRMSDAVNRLVLQVSDHEEHPLGPVLLDEYLRDFANPAARDVAWSLPKQRHHDVVVAMYEERQLLEHMPKLRPGNTATQMPLVFAWALASVSNLKRTYCRAELVIWGMRNPHEFVLLFERFCNCDDPQIREDMFAIAAEIVCQGKPDHDAEKALGHIALDSVFSDPDKPGNRDAAVRHFGRLLVERCHTDGLLTVDEACSCLPPYAVEDTSVPLPVYPDACGNDRHNGYWPIHYDLSRYVLVYHLESAFGLNHHWPSSSTENIALDRLLDASAEAAGIPKPGFDGWTIGATYQYLLDHGYSQSVFETTTLPDGSRADGVDNLILLTYHHADHGSRSEVMTVAEKYVWCARNEICGYMADRIPVSADSLDVGERAHADAPELARDYSRLLDFDSPLLEATYSRTKKKRGDSVPHFTDEFACDCEALPCAKEELESWIDGISPDIGISLLQYRPDTPLAIESETVPINLYALSWGLCGKECVVWACAGAANVSELDKLDTAQTSYINGYDLSSGFEVGFDGSGGATYLSPVEAISGSVNLELDETFETDIVADACINAKPLSGKGVSTLTDVGDYWYLFPSALARKLCGANNTDGALYTDDDGAVLFENIDFGIPYRRHYNALLADKDRLLGALREHDLCLIWHMTVRKNANALARERLGDSIMSAENSWLVWLDKEDVMHSCPISHERPEKTSSYEMPDLLKELIDEQDELLYDYNGNDGTARS